MEVLNRISKGFAEKPMRNTPLVFSDVSLGGLEKFYEALSGKYDDEQKHLLLMEILTTDPNFAELHFWIAACSGGSLTSQKRIEFSQQAAKLAPTNKRFQILCCALERLFVGAHGSAEKLFSEALRSSKTPTETGEALYFRSFAREEPEEAIIDLLEASKLYCPGWCYYNLMYTYIENNKPSALIDHTMEQALKYTNFKALITLGKYYAKKRANTETAKLYLEKARKLNPSSAFPLRELFYITYNPTYFHTVLSLEKNGGARYEDCTRLQGAILMDSGTRDGMQEATQLLTTLVTVFPNCSASCHFSLADYIEEMNNKFFVTPGKKKLPEFNINQLCSITHFRAAVCKSPFDDEYQFSLANVLYKKDPNSTEAIQRFKNVYTIHSKLTIDNIPKAVISSPSFCQLPGFVFFDNEEEGGVEEIFSVYCPRTLWLVLAFYILALYGTKIESLIRLWDYYHHFIIDCLQSKRPELFTKAEAAVTALKSKGIAVEEKLSKIQSKCEPSNSAIEQKSNSE